MQGKSRGRRILESTVLPESCFQGVNVEHPNGGFLTVTKSDREFDFYAKMAR